MRFRTVYRKTKVQREAEYERKIIKKLRLKAKLKKKQPKQTQQISQTVLGNGQLNQSRPNSYFKDYLDYCRSEYFKILKRKVLCRDKYKCQKCKGKAQTAHHEKYRPRWTDSRVEDCIAICHKCHKEIHYEDIVSKELYYIENPAGL